MAKKTTTYFHRMNRKDDLAGLLEQHRKVFPSNTLAVLEGAGGQLLVKVAMPYGSARPPNSLTAEEALAEAAKRPEGEALRRVHGAER